MADDQYISKRVRRVSETLLVSVLLLTLLCIYFWPVIFRGFVLSPSDMIFEFPFFKEAAPAGFQRASNALLSDAVLQFYPWHTATRKAFQDGQFPYWNPYIYCGTPLFANCQSAVLYPINFLGRLLPLDVALTFSPILHMFIAGLGTFLFLRELKVGSFGAAVAAVTFMLGGSMTIWFYHTVINVYAWMPVLFFLGERLLVRRDLLYVSLTSVAIAMQLLAGNYEISLIVLIAWWLYCTYRVVDISRDNGNKRQAIGTFLLLVTTVALGLLIVAVQLLPSWEWLQQTHEFRSRPRERSLSWVDPSFWKSVVVTLVTLVLPNFNSNPTWGSPMSFFHSNYIEETVYVGIVPLALSIVAVLGRYKVGLTPKQSVKCNGSSLLKRGWVLFIAGLGVFFLCMAWRLPGVDLLNHLPVFSLVLPVRYRIAFVFCLSILAGVGAECIFYLPTDSAIFRWLLRGLVAFIGVGATLLVIARWMIIEFEHIIVRWNRIRELYPILVDAFSLSNWSMYFPILIAIGFLIWLISYRSKHSHTSLFRLTCMILIIGDLFLFGRGFHVFIPRNWVFPKTESIQFLQDRLAVQDPVRIVALNNDLPPDIGTIYGLSEIAGSDFSSQRYTELAQTMGGELSAHRIVFSVLQPQLINLMNVKYVIASTEPQGVPSEQLREVYRDSSVKIYENLNCLPRAYAVHQAKIVNDDAQILEILTSPAFDPRSQIVIEEPPPSELPENASSFSDLVQIMQYQPQQVSIQVELAENGFLFLSDAYYPGWQAFVNGEEAKIYRANYAFRAVYLPKGKHSVQFVYTPAGFRLGLAITAAGLVLVLAILVMSWKKQTQGGSSWRNL